MESSATSCAGFSWLSFAELRSQIMPEHSWMLFVGDSDTRFLVFELLQILAAGAHTPAVAARNPAMWLGDIGHKPPHNGFVPSPRDSQREWSSNFSMDLLRAKELWLKRCMVDHLYDARGLLVANRSVHCLLGTESFQYAALGQNYTLLPDATVVPDGGIRVTFVGTSYFGQTVTSLKGLEAQLKAQQLSSSLTDMQRGPTLLYLGIGAWLSTSQLLGAPPSPTTLEDHAAKLAERLDALRRLLPPRSVLIRATTLAQLNRNRTFDDYLARHLARHSDVQRVARGGAADEAAVELGEGVWRSFDRSTPFTWNTTREGRRGLNLVSGHAPPIVNWLDWQRLVDAKLLLRRGLHNTSPPPSRPSRAEQQQAQVADAGTALASAPWSACVHGGAQLTFGTSCAGFLPGFAGRPAFAEPMFHFCDVRDVSRGAAPQIQKVAAPL